MPVGSLSHLNKYLLKYKFHLILGFCFVIAANFFSIQQPKVIRQALDLVIDNLRQSQLYKGSSLEAAFLRDMGSDLLYFGLLVLGLATVMGIFMYFTRQTVIVMSRLIEYDMRKEIFGHYLTLDLAFYRKNMTGDLMARISEDVSKVRMYLGPAILYGMNLVVLFVFVIWSMFRVNVTLSIYSLLPLPFLSLTIYFVSSVIHNKSSVIQKQLSRLNSIAQEVYSGIRVVKSYVHENFMAKNFEKECDDFKDKSMELATVNALFFPVMLFIIGISTIITIYVGGLQVFKGNITTGNIAEFVIYVNMLTWPVTSIGWIASIIQQASASQDRINEFLVIPPAIVNESEEKKPIKGDVVFDNVSFTYSDTGIEALKDVDFALKGGEKLALIGKTGSGKTTVADLLMRMFEVSIGSIEIDGIDIKKHNLSHLRDRIGYVPQDVFLFSDTVSNNITFGKPDADIEAVHAYAKNAAVYEDIQKLPEQFETMVGERGVTLSGGQKQRVSIARSFIKDPDIIILDDCLSAVDTKTEKQILGYLKGALADKTAIIITHRIYGLLEFDKIIVMDEGRIVEMGTHDELIANKGQYAELYEKQRLSADSNVA